MQSTPSFGSFMSTRWTLVLRANASSPEGKAALSDLCEAYYQPVFVFLRRIGFDADTARDHAHSFFTHLLQRGFPGPDPDRGRFRSYLLGAVKHFLANRRRDAAREKRGGGAEHVAFGEGTDTSPGVDVTDATALPPDSTFDRAWALATVERALVLLEGESEEAGQTAHFTTLKPWLTPAASPASQADTAAQLGLSEGAVKVAIHRLRRRFREIVRAEVAQTLHDPAELDDEMRHLVDALAD